MSDHPSTYEPGTAIERWLDTRLPIIRFSADLMSFPTPRNLNYWYTFGGILAFCLAVQIVYRHRAGDALRSQRRRAPSSPCSATSCAT